MKTIRARELQYYADIGKEKVKGVQFWGFTSFWIGVFMYFINWWVAPTICAWDASPVWILRHLLWRDIPIYFGYTAYLLLGISIPLLILHYTWKLRKHDLRKWEETLEDED